MRARLRSCFLSHPLFCIFYIFAHNLCIFQSIRIESPVSQMKLERGARLEFEGELGKKDISQRGKRTAENGNHVAAGTVRRAWHAFVSLRPLLPLLRRPPRPPPSFYTTSSTSRATFFGGPQGRYQQTEQLRPRVASVDRCVFDTSRSLFFSHPTSLPGSVCVAL